MHDKGIGVIISLTVAMMVRQTARGSCYTRKRKNINHTLVRIHFKSSSTYASKTKQVWVYAGDPIGGMFDHVLPFVVR